MRTKNSELFSKEAERSVLGCLLGTDEDDAEMLEDIFTGIGETDFADPEHKLVYKAMETLYDKGKSINLVTVMEVLGRMCPTADGSSFLKILGEAGNMLPSKVNYKTFTDVVREYSALRKLDYIFALGKAEIQDKEPSLKIIRNTEERLTKYEDGKERGKVEHIAAAVEEEQERIVKIINGERDDFGLATGFPVLDKTLWGMQKSDLIIVGARAGVGKTAFALNVLNHASGRGAKCLFFSLEMPKRQIARRLISLKAEIPNQELNYGVAENRVKIGAAALEIKNGGLYIDDTTNNTVTEMSLKAKRMQKTVGLDLVVVDYLQFVTPGKKSGNRFLDVGEIARELKVMARQLNVPVIALCQLNRALDKDERQPTLADLRESGEIENNADVIMFLHPTDGKFKEVRNVELIIGKFRNGQMKAIKMEYEGRIYKFRELDKAAKEKSKQVAMDDLIPMNGDLPF